MFDATLFDAKGALRRGCALLALLALVACKPATETGPESAAEPETSPPPGEEAPTMPDPVMTSELAGSWRLLSIDDDDSPAGLDNPVTLEFTTDGVGGHSGVNRYRLTVQVDSTAGTIGFGTGMSTLMAGPPEAMALEQDYLAALGEVDRYQVEDGRLRLLAAEEVRLTFERAP